MAFRLLLLGKFLSMIFRNSLPMSVLRLALKGGLYQIMCLFLFFLVLCLFVVLLWGSAGGVMGGSGVGEGCVGFVGKVVGGDGCVGGGDGRNDRLGR